MQEYQCLNTGLLLTKKSQTCGIISTIHGFWCIVHFLDNEGTELNIRQTATELNNHHHNKGPSYIRWATSYMTWQEIKMTTTNNSSFCFLVPWSTAHHSTNFPAHLVLNRDFQTLFEHINQPIWNRKMKDSCLSNEHSSTNFIGPVKYNYNAQKFCRKQKSLICRSNSNNSSTLTPSLL